MTTSNTEAMRAEFEQFWEKTRGKKKAWRELHRHPLQPQTYVQDSANRHWTTWQAASRSSEDKGVPEGFVAVPVEPTREMLDAYVKVDGRFHSGRADWAAMLAAAPRATEAGTDGADEAKPRNLIRRASAQLTRWQQKYAEHQPHWLPPAGDVRLQEEIDAYLQPPPQSAPVDGGGNV